MTSIYQFIYTQYDKETKQLNLARRDYDKRPVEKDFEITKVGLGQYFTVCHFGDFHKVCSDIIKTFFEDIKDNSYFKEHIRSELHVSDFSTLVEKYHIINNTFLYFKKHFDDNYYEINIDNKVVKINSVYRDIIEDI